MGKRIVHNLATPLLRTWASESHLESMALLQKDSMEWMLNNYVNLMGSRNDQTENCALELIPRHDPACNDVTLCSWIRCPFIEYHPVSHNYVREQYGNILDYIMFAIEEGYYVYVKINQANLSTRMMSRFHSPFIYGFDLQKRILYVADHYNQGKYALAELGFDEFYRAYQFTYWENNGCKLLNKGMDAAWQNEVIHIARSRQFKYEFNLEWFKIQLKDYLDSTYRLNSIAAVTEGEGYKRYFGISSFDLIIDYLDSLLANGKEVQKDWRLFTIICDHKKLTKMRVDFFEEMQVYRFDSQEKEQYNGLFLKSEILLNLFLKYLLSNRSEILEKMKSEIREMKSNEDKLLSRLQKNL